jgi:lipoate-protein ligase A
MLSLVESRMICRLFQCSSPDARVNAALEEAMLIARRKEQLLDRIRLQQHSEAVVLGSNAVPQDSVNIGASQARSH